MAKAKTPAAKPATAIVAKPAVPSFLQTIGNAKTNVKGKIATVNASPYVQFMHNAQKNYGDVVAKFGKLAPSQPVYVNGNDLIKLDVLEFIMTPIAFHCFAIIENDGTITAALPPEGRCPQGYRDTFETVCVVITQKALLPCRIRFAGPKARGGINAQNVIVEGDAETCGDVYRPDWAGRSNEHKFIAKTGLPNWAWATHTGSLEGQDPKDTSRGQERYEVLNTLAKPTSMIVAKMLTDGMKDEGFNKVFNDCINDHNKNVEALERAMPKG